MKHEALLDNCAYARKVYSLEAAKISRRIAKKSVGFGIFKIDRRAWQRSKSKHS